VISAVLLAATVAFSQTTYYSRDNGAGPPYSNNWDDANAWTLSSDPSGPAAPDYPKRGDHVVILADHEIIVDAKDDNDGTPISANAYGASIGATNIGNNGSPFNTPAGFNDTNFLHEGDVSIEVGGELTINTRSMWAGTVFVAGSMTASVGSGSADVINLGDMFFTSSASFSSTDDLIGSGDSFTRIDIPSSTNSWTSDDIYLDHQDAFVCGLGILGIGNSGGSGHIINLNNNATLAQICPQLTISGCSPDPPGTCPPGTGAWPFAAPSLTGTGGSFTYIENQVVIVDGGIGLTYSDLYLSEATVTISADLQNTEDELVLPATPGFISSYDAPSGVLTISGYGTVAEWESVLQSVTYENLSDNPTVPSTKTVDFVITDGFGTSNTVSREIIIQAVNDPPDVSSITGSGTPLPYKEGDGEVEVDPLIEVNDPDNTTLAGAEITITGAYQMGEDILAFTNTADITGVFNPLDGKLTLSSVTAQPLTDYETALKNVRYKGY
jgi:hypothetical protein